MASKVQKLSIVQGVLSVDFEKIGKSLRLDLNPLTEKYGQDAMWHGWKQRFGDLKSGDETGAEKYVEMQRLYDHLIAGGDWAMTAQRDTMGVVVEALSRLQKKYSREDLLKAAEKKPEQVKAWRADPHVKAMIAKIYAEKAAAAAKEAEKSEINIEI